MVAIAGAMIATVAASDTPDSTVADTPLRKIVPVRTAPETYEPFDDEPGVSPIPSTIYPTDWVIPSTVATPEKPVKTKTVTVKPTKSIKPDPGTVKPKPSKTKSPEPTPTEVSPDEPLPTVTAPTKS
jgi:hypothetical protein